MGSQTSSIGASRSPAEVASPVFRRGRCGTLVLLDALLPDLWDRCISTGAPR